MVAMHITAPGLKEETHTDTNQTFIVESGTAELVLNKVNTSFLQVFGVTVVEKHTSHELKVAPGQTLKLLTIYTPPHHPPGRLDLERPSDE